VKTCLGVLLLFCSFVCYADDCTFDSKEQIEYLQKIMRSHPGGTLDKTARKITWASPKATASSVAYGGCYDFGFVVTKNVSPKEKLAEKEVLALAKALAREYWEPAESKALIAAIAGKNFTIRSEGGVVYYEIPSEQYSELDIEYDRTRGCVTIAWSGDF